MRETFRERCDGKAIADSIEPRLRSNPISSLRQERDDYRNGRPLFRPKLLSERNVFVNPRPVLLLKELRMIDRATWL